MREYAVNSFCAFANLVGQRAGAVLEHLGLTIKNVLETTDISRQAFMKLLCALFNNTALACKHIFDFGKIITKHVSNVVGASMQSAFDRAGACFDHLMLVRQCIIDTCKVGVDVRADRLSTG